MMRLIAKLHFPISWPNRRQPQPAEGRRIYLRADRALDDGG
jgi:hypothetical protein